MMHRLLHLLIVSSFVFSLINSAACSSQEEKGQEKNKKTITSTNLDSLQQAFLDLRFGMFIHFSIPTYGVHDWADPLMDAELFNPKKLDCRQWADVAQSAGMRYGCLTTKHHSGFCVWPTKTTDYSVASSSCNKDVVKEYVDAFREKGLKVCLYYSILDIHHNIRAGWANDKSHLDFIKRQLTELLTNYGEITCLVVDGWDAEWSRISYEDISFREIYDHVKSLQPNCLICEHNAGEYPGSGLFYTDIKQYEQHAGQMISKETNQLPAQAGIPINKNWFWKKEFPTAPVVSADSIVNGNLIPMNEAHCNFILNVAPNPDGLIDANAVAELKKVGEMWKHPGKAPLLEKGATPIIDRNLAKHCRMNSSWSLGKRTPDLASDDDFTTAWVAQEAYDEHYIEVILNEEQVVNAIGFMESTDPKKYPALQTTRIGSYDLQYFNGESWHAIEVEQSNELLRLHRFVPIRTAKIRVNFHQCAPGLGVSEVLVYNERR